MSLAARCTTCATVFRVVQDQLRVSEGWVRCGRCGEIFNAVENLVQIDSEVAPPAHDDVKPARADAVEAAAASPEHVEADNGVQMPIEAAPPATSVALPSAPAPGALPAPKSETAPPVPAAPPFNPAPRFVRRADRAARWQRPGVRIALSAATLLLGAALVLQVVFEFRGAARWTALRPLLEAACGLVGCSVAPARWIEALAVDSSGLVRIDGTALYRLSVALKNRSTAAVTLPALDLSLTDAKGSLMARRVIGADELGVRQRALDPHAEVVLQATLAAADRPVAGYTIEIFYP